MSYDKVISLTGNWAAAIFHFPMEYVTALFSLPRSVASMTSTASLIDYEDYKIHVGETNSWVISWLALLGIGRERLVTGSIYAQRLVVPLSNKCGTPLAQSVHHFRKYVLTRLALSTQSEQRDNSILLVQRNGSRAVTNHDEVSAVVQKHASRLGLSFVTHSPPFQHRSVVEEHSSSHLLDQVRRFSSARIIVAPHGAALLFSVFAPPDVCIIELMYPSAGQINLCFLRISTKLGHKHIGISMDPLTNTVQSLSLQEALLQCASGAS